MKILYSLLSAGLVFGFVACTPSTNTLVGFISDAGMSTVTVSETVTGDTYVFLTEDADMSEAHGLILGAPVTVQYTGDLGRDPVAVKVMVNATYCKAIGTWTMPDPIDSEKVMGIEIAVDTVRSINMATLVYEGWELLGGEDRILLKGRSLGNGVTIAVLDTATIFYSEAGVLSLAIQDTGVVLAKE